MSDDANASDSPYVTWKGWAGATPFAYLDRGERAYFRSELRALTREAEIHDVLEVGYGNGAFLTYCQEQGWAVTGTELDPELVQAAVAAGFTAVGSEAAAQLPERSYDLVVLFDVLEHIPQEDIVGFLEFLALRLRPGGRMLLRFPNADSWLGNPLQYGDPTHVTAIGYLKMTYFALQASLHIDSFTGARRHGFATSTLHGIYSITAGPLVRVAAEIQRILYFPMLPVVLWTSNVVCVVRPRLDPQ